MSSPTTRAAPPRLPGVAGIWVLIGADAVFFAMLFGCFMLERRRDPALFESSRQALNLTLGGINTLVLLTSSWLVALAMLALARDDHDRVPRYLLAAVLTGLLFVASKVTEYVVKVAAGITPASNPFFMWFFALTGIHLLHVLLGTAALTVVWRQSRHGVYRSTNRAVPETAASFWHLVDLLWIMLFPLLYLLKVP